MAQIDNAGLSRFRRWYSQYRATHGTTPPRNMVSSFMQGEIEASIARMDKARELGLRQESLNLQRQGMEYEKDISERRLSLTKEMYEKELGMKEKEIGKQDRAAKWSGIGTAVVAAPTAYKIGKAAYDWAIGSMAPESGMGTVMGGTVEGLEAGLPAIGTMSTPTIAATGTGEMMGGAGGMMGGAEIGTLGAAETTGMMGGTGGMMGGAEIAPATTGGLSAYLGPVAAIAAPLLGYLGGHRAREKTQHGYEDWLSTLTPGQKGAYFDYQNRNWRWNAALGQFGGGLPGRNARVGAGAIGTSEGETMPWAAPSPNLVPAGLEKPPDWLTPTMVFKGDLTPYTQPAPMQQGEGGMFWDPMSGDTPLSPTRTMLNMTPEQVRELLYNRSNWQEDPRSYYSGTSRGMGIYR